MHKSQLVHRIRPLEIVAGNLEYRKAVKEAFRYREDRLAQASDKGVKNLDSALDKLRSEFERWNDVAKVALQYDLNHSKITYASDRKQECNRIIQELMETLRLSQEAKFLR